RLRRYSQGMTTTDWQSPLTLDDVPTAWRDVVREVMSTPEFVAFARELTAPGLMIAPPRCDCFTALALTRPDDVRAVIIGEDPYPTPGDAHGLAFSVRQGQKKIPRSLQNIFKRLQDDIGLTALPSSGSLEPWA